MTQQHQNGLVVRPLQKGDTCSWEAVEWLRGSCNISSEMAQMIIDKDWSKTPLGPLHSWPPCLLTSLSNMLSSKFPMILSWGPDFICLYNDAYISILGAKHPEALGLPCSILFSEIWDDIVGPLFHGIASRKVGHWSEDLLMTLFRNGYDEECYFTFSYGPVIQSDGTVGGILTPVTETTQRVIAERRMKMLRLLSSRTSLLTNADAVVQASMDVFSEETADIPFAFCYLLEGKEAVLKAVCKDFPRDKIPIKIEVSPEDGEVSEDSWGLHRVLSKGTMVQLDGLAPRFGKLPSGQWEKCPDHAVVLPLKSSSGAEELIGVLCLGINPMKRLNEDYQAFLDLVCNQLASAIISARAYEQERKRAKALEDLNRAKTAFFQNISHEFRTPLHLGLASLKEVLQLPDLAPSVQNRVEMAHRNTLLLLKLVNSLLEFSRIEANRHQPNYKPINVPALTRNIACMFQSAFDDAKLRFTVDTDAFPAGQVYLDPDMWEKIILNLLSNAFKFTLQGEVAVRLQREGEMAVLTVADTGIGIPESDLPRLFARFHRVEGARGRSFEGSGIGCSLICELTQLLGGTVEVQSILGQGTTFTVRVPLREASSDIPPSNVPKSSMDKGPSLQGQAFVEEALRWLPGKEEASAERDLQEGGKGPMDDMPIMCTGSILLVDDNPDMRSYISSILLPKFKVTVKSNGVEAFDYLGDPSIDLPNMIISDVMMPQMDGLQLLGHIRKGINGQATGRLPVILLSARAGEESRLEGLKHGADDYLVKPFSKKELLARVSFHLTVAMTREKLEKQLAEQTKELRENEERYRELAENVPAAIYYFDKDGRITFVNQAWKRIVMLQEGEDPNNWSPKVHPDDLERAQEFIRMGLEDHLESTLDEYRVIRRDGSQVVLIARQIPLFRDGQFNGLLGVATDVSRIKELEEENLQAVQRTETEQRKRAEEAEENRRRLQAFVDVISHEIRNPISNIMNIAELLKTSTEQLRERLENPMKVYWYDGNVRDEAMTQIQNDQKLLRAIELCANHQKVIADDVLELSRLQSNHFSVLREQFQPRQLIKDIMRMFESALDTKGILVSIYMPPEEETQLVPSSVLGDQKRIKQVLVNIISNAIKFMEKCATRQLSIRLAAGPTDGYSGEESTDEKEKKDEPHHHLQFTVEDTGIGMSMEEQTQLFKPFSQANMKTYRDYGGSGMGLFICRMIVERLGGRISLKSKQGVGTSFTFTARCFPLEKGGNAGIKAHAAADKKEPLPTSDDKQDEGGKECNGKNAHEKLAGMRVLIVDDNPLNQKILDRQLRAVKMQTVLAGNGLEAFQLIQRHQPVPSLRFHAVLLDVEMPIMNGLEAIQEIRKWEIENQMSPVPVIGLSGNAREEHVQGALEAGMSSYITKPYRRESLLTKLNALVHRSMELAPGS